MRSLKWTSSHAVFVPEIDDDHKDIFEVLAQLDAALRSGESDEINGLTARLADRIADHFAHEERLMRAARYGLLSWHKRSHDAARRRVARFLGRIGRGDAQAAPALVGYLTEWLHNHTRVPDRMMGAFLRNQRRAAKIVFTVTTGGSRTWLNSRGEPFDPESGSGF